MKSLLITAMTLVSLMLMSSTAYSADFDKGMEAYGKGDYKTALEEWRPHQGYASALYNLALMYRNGEGVPKDDKEAVKWYRLAAEQGHASAQNNLALMYRNGEVVLQDSVYAHMWWNIASANGSKEGSENRDALAKRMTPSQIEKAQELARQCMKKEYKDC
jgi:hypothetical protein